MQADCTKRLQIRQIFGLDFYDALRYSVNNALRY